MTSHVGPDAHPYVRAYLAGIAIPTAFLLVILTVSSIAHGLHHIPMALDRVLVFPMALGPNLWGAWNIVYVAIARRRSWPLGGHGALLALLVGPLAWTIAQSFGMTMPTLEAALAVFPFVVITYYLLWKYGVRFLNGVLGLG